MIFLQELAGMGDLGGMGPEALIAAFAAYAAIASIIGLILWIYMSLAYMAIGKKAGLSMPGLAWIPGIGPLIITFQAAKMHWWPWLLLIGMVIPFVNVIANIAFTVYVVIWSWKMFEAINKPGWWAILLLIPVLNLIMIGIAAWSKN